VSLGADLDNACVNIDCMKGIEEERNLRMLEKNINDTVDMDTGPSNLLVSKVSSLCEDLVDDENDFDGDDELVDMPLPNIKEKKIRQKKVYDVSNIRRSNRKRIKKIY
jgi:hypothetical protein